MSTKFILENSASLGATDELKWFLVPQLVVTVTMAAFPKEKGENVSLSLSLSLSLSIYLSVCLFQPSFLLLLT